MTFFDGYYYVEDVASARISNLLSHQNIHLSEKQREDIARTIMGAMAGYLIGEGDSYGEFIKCRKEKWGLGE